MEKAAVQVLLTDPTFGTLSAACISPDGLKSFIRKDDVVKEAMDAQITAARPPQCVAEVANIQPPAVA